MRLVIPTETSLLESAGVLVPGASNRTLRQLLRHGRVRLNGAVCRIGSRHVMPGDVVEVVAHGDAHSPGRGLKILFEDKDILIVEKPAGLLTVATEHERERTVFACLRQHIRQRDSRQKLFIVHRLDKFASGVLVFAKSPEVQAKLRALFAGHNIKRKYWAIVEGRVARPRGTVRSFLAENRAQRMYPVGDRSAGKEAITHYRVLRRFPQLTAMEITLETGRKNQIRVHMAELGHPIVGDRAYGSKTDPLGRLGLHAFLLGFSHPTLCTPVLYRAGTPPEFARYIPGVDA